MSSLVVFAKAEYDFDGPRADCLNFKKGDIITVLKRDEQQAWWTGSSLDGKIGIFPKNYVELNGVREAYDVAVAEFTFEAELPTDLGFEDGDEIIVIKQLSPDWWRGKCNGREGVFPACYVRLTGELDYAAAEAEAEKWRQVVDTARQYSTELTRKREEAEKELEEERVRLEQANAAAAEARAAAEAESKAARDAKRDAQVESAKKREIELNKQREEAERRHEEARARLVSMKMVEDASLQQIRAAANNDEAKRERQRKKKDDDERFADPLANMAGAEPKKGPGEGKDDKKPTKFGNLGGGDKCPKCGLAVGMAEKVKGPGDTNWHAQCLRCNNCNKQLLGGNWQDSKGVPLCAVCFGRLAAPQYGFRSGAGGSAGFAQNDQSKPRAKGTVEIDEISPLEALKKGGKPR